MSPSGGEVLLDLFQSSGIENIFCASGAEWVPVWESLSRRFGQGERNLKYFDCRHETLAVSAAMGYSEAAHGLSAVLLHTSVGPLHAAMAIRTAYMAQVPVVICSGEPPDHSGQEVLPPGGRWISVLSDMGGPSAMVKPYVKWSNIVSSRETLLDSVYRGCLIARTPPRGPVFLSFSRDLLFSSMPGLESLPKTYSGVTLTEPSKPALKEIARQLIDSLQPIIITDSAGRNPQNAGKLTELAELLSIPVFESKNAYCANIDRDHPLYQGSDDTEALQKADTVLIVSSVIPWYPPRASPKQARTILLDEDPLHEKLPFWGYRIDLSVTGDTGISLTELVRLVRSELKKTGQSETGRRDRFNYWQGRHNQLFKRWKAEGQAGQKNKPISPEWFFQALRPLLPENSLILNEAIVHTPLIERHLARVGQYSKVGYGALGTGLGQAAGIKLANPDKLVVLFVGDGGFNFNPVPAALGLCQQYKLPILVVVLNNSGYMAMKRDHKLHYPEGWAACHNEYLGVNITPSPDYSKLAEAFGGYGEHLEDPEKIGPAVKRALKQIESGKVVLLDVIIDNP